MIKIVKIIIPIVPVEQQRPRFTRGKFAHMYDPPKVKNFKKSLAELVKEQYRGKPLEGELVVEVTFYRQVQKSISKKEHDRRVSGEHKPTVKPDLSNYVKSYEDALNGILWADDAMITDEYAHKRYADNPRIEIEVTRVAGSNSD